MRLLPYMMIYFVMLVQAIAFAHLVGEAASREIIGNLDTVISTLKAMNASLS